ncbi:ribonuclease III [Legionella geestiana]|uniref:Ribonuclease 3 n=2 Tax=Legionella geestiana TaxID=45065 RepID=A0A0W0TW57_9GAMM|nr:ribonuclease III [Legionella geestiana]STX54247.1 ribonuclease III [Legionella geestiana]
MSVIEITRLMRRLDYSFSNEALLRQALTHRSAGSLNNERLEFLGDSVLSCVVANALVSRFPAVEEGTLSRLRAALVKGETLAVLATELGIGDCLVLGQGELKSGGFRRESILADALEAIIAAIFLDGGFEACNRCVLKWFNNRLEDENILHSLKDAKTRLQEYLQAERLPLPQYEVVAVVGDEPNQVFTVECRAGDKSTRGKGTNRRKAEQLAAEALLNALGSGRGL